MLGFRSWLAELDFSHTPLIGRVNSAADSQHDRRRRLLEYDHMASHKSFSLGHKRNLTHDLGTNVFFPFSSRCYDERRKFWRRATTMPNRLGST